MRKTLLFAFFFLFSASFPAQNLDWFYFLTQGQSVYSGNFQNGNRSYSITIDSDENVYMVGSYQENLGVDPSNPTVLQLNSANGPESNQCFLVKFDKNKNYLWHRTISIGLNSAASIFSITIDKNENVIIAGTATGNNINLDPSSATPVLYNTDNNLQQAIFLNKYSKDGDFIYGNFYKGGMGIPKVTVDKNSDVFLVGQYHNYFAGYNTDFDLSGQDFYLNGAHGSAFILKNDSNGNIINAKFLQGGRIEAIQFDNDNNLVIFGNAGRINYNNEASFINETNGTGGGDFILKTNAAMAPIWFQTIGGQDIYSFLYDSKPFDIDSDNSIVVSTTRPAKPVSFKNQTVEISEPLTRAVLFKIDQDGKYLWHSTVQQAEHSQSFFPITVSIASDHTINWTVKLNEEFYFTAVGEKIEEGVAGFSYAGTFNQYTSLLKLNSNGKLIYNKHKILDHNIGRTDRTHDKMYFSGQGPTSDPNPDMTVNNPAPHIPGIKRAAYIQKLDKCYSGVPDGNDYFYSCTSALKKIKDLYPRTSYSSWYDSPTSSTPLSPETILETKKYYAETRDISCPRNPTRLAVDVRIFQSPPKLVVNDFTFCNLQGKKLSDLKINNNIDIEFFDASLRPLGGNTLITANTKYLVRQFKTYSIYARCWSDYTSFHVYDTSVAPTASNSQAFCKLSDPTISDLVVNGINLKWYDQTGNILSTSTLLENNKKYFVSQTSGTCESAKAEITVTLNDPSAPTGSIQQDFCSAQHPTVSNLTVSGQNVIWYDSSGTILTASAPLSNGKTYYATQTVGGCESTQKLAVKVSVANGGIPAGDYSTAFCNDTVSNTKTVNLNDYKTNLIANTSGLTFDFFDSANQSISNPANQKLTVGANEFNVKISNALGCFVNVKLTLTLDPKPLLNMPQTAGFCNGQPVNVDAGSGFSSYEWSKENNPAVISTSQIFSVSTAGKYTVKVKNSFGCENSASVTVTQSSLGVITGVQIVNNSATVIMSNPGDFLYSLDNVSWQNSNSFTNLSNGNHTAFVKTSGGCVIGHMNFTIFNVPKSFTPNADGINDTWKVDGMENYPNSDIKVYDRNGNTVLSKITTGAFEWDGKLDSRALPTGSYWYIIKVSDGRILNGWVLIKNRN